MQGLQLKRYVLIHLESAYQYYELAIALLMNVIGIQYYCVFQ
ncbi:MAG: hypothetical protein ACJASG_000188 [Oleiphilaceae bacterium]|jgi:hypothetical protein